MQVRDLPCPAREAADAAANRLTGRCCRHEGAATRWGTIESAAGQRQDFT